MNRPEALLDESEVRFRLMADHAPVMLWMSGTDGKCGFFNQGWLQFTGRALEEEVGDGWAEGVHPQDFQNCMDVYLDAFHRREPFRMEYRLRRADGDYRWILDHGVPRYAPDGSFAGFIGSCIDITDRKQAEDRTRASLREKEVLLKELHHRVKNNLQIIHSFFNLEAQHMPEGPNREKLKDCRERVRTMALIHEKLYQSNDLGRINFSDYLRELGEGLFQAFGAASGVRLSVSADGARLGMDQAVPCSLIVYELVSNCLKHAFPPGRAGSIRVALSPRPEGLLQLSVRDDGAGLPPQVDFQNTTSLGLQLVCSLAKQLEGKIELLRDVGTEFRLTFRAATPGAASRNGGTDA